MITHLAKQIFLFPCTIYSFSNNSKIYKYFQLGTSIESDCVSDSSTSIEDSNIVRTDAQRKVYIHNKLGNWYSPFCNRWLSLFGVSTITFLLLIEKS